MSGCDCSCCSNRRKEVTVSIRTRVNGGSLTDRIKMTVRDGEEIIIDQPVEVTFKAAGEPKYGTCVCTIYEHP